MIRKRFIGLAVAATACLATMGVPSTAEAQRHYYRPYPAYRSYYHSAPVVYPRPVYYPAPVVYSRPVVYTTPVVYARPAYYAPYYYGPSYYGPTGISFGYYGGHGHHHGGVSVRVGF